MKPKNLFGHSGESWSKEIDPVMSNNDYVKLNRVRMVGMVLNVYARRLLFEQISNVQASYRRTGFGGLYGNKGATGVSFNLRGKNILLINSHLAPHDEKYDERVGNYKDIVERMSLGGRSVLDHDLILWMGDLNFRIDSYTIQHVVDATKHGADSDQMRSLLASDQLIKARRTGQAFEGFHENIPKFLPTYKLYPGSDNYDMRRKPAWTDRILYKVKSDGNNNQLAVKQETYDAHFQFKQSDHKPVSSLFIVSFN